MSKRMKSQLGDVHINFDYTTPFAVTKNGKIKAVISELK